MNERIAELHKQAQKVVGYTDGGYTEIKALDAEKFAELIVKECVEYYCSQIGETSEPHTKTLKHFGIE